MPRTLQLPKDGIHRGIPMGDYLRFDGWHKGDIEGILAESPAHVMARRELEEEPSDAAAFGTVVHAAVLEPDRFDQDYRPMPEGDGRTAAVRDAKKAIEQAGKVPVKPADLAAARKIRKTLLECELTRSALLAGDGENEVTFVWTDPATGLRLLARPDRLTPSLGLILDLKTARDAAPEPFARACAFYGYDVGTAHYLSGAKALGLEIDDLLYVVVPSDPPHIPYVYRMTDEWVAAARTRRAEGLAMLKECAEDGIWPAGNEGVITIQPGYGRKLELGLVEGR